MPILAVLLESDGRDTQSDMAEELSVDPATVTRGLSRLEELGYVKRMTSERDSRAHRIELTPSGREAARAATEASLRWNEAIAAGWPAQERQELLRSMRRMLNQLREELGGS